MALIIVFHNDATGPDESANYNVRVMVGDGTKERTIDIDGGRVEGHDRANGWAALVQAYLNQYTARPRSEPQSLSQQRRFMRQRSSVCVLDHASLRAELSIKGLSASCPDCGAELT